jgi:hypothetical protein
LSRTKFPAGWDERKVRRVISYYEKQSEEEAAREDEAALKSSKTVMSVPRDLVPKVRELIAKHNK